ncbi:hypothetical protein PRK78_005149 [Emydomyces testavorans]|uniref:Domain of unknown function at the cortex 1 domain-containing protein n=1 Tax=Emydomyces testavorans TaxID=2070801 RepID=A0AAF0DJ57_9EURO|nr:hypothetical protein PRK78_005149 [Emydomyces testavorans]
MPSDDATEHYTLKVTAGPTYDPETHRIVPVNADETLTIETEHTTVKLCVRIRDYAGLPFDTPRTSSYFSHPERQDDQYAISVALIPKRTISGSELVFGNDFDHPIRDRLPPGTNYALKIVKWMIDPGLEGDAYADQPYLYGAALSSWNYFRICEREGVISESVSMGGEASMANGGESRADSDQSDGDEGLGDNDMAGSITTMELHEEVVAEGGEGTGKEIRESLGIPDDPHHRKKHFLDEMNRQMFEFEAGRLYKADFGNPYLGFSGNEEIEVETRQQAAEQEPEEPEVD